MVDPTARIYAYVFSSADAISVANRTAGVDCVVGTWALIGFVYDGAAIRAYCNGVQVASTNAVITLKTGDQAVEIGARNSNLQPVGYIGDVRLYNRALTAAEVWQLYDPATRWELYAPLRKWWAIGAAAAGAVGLWPRYGVVGGKGKPFISPDLGAIG